MSRRKDKKQSADIISIDNLDEVSNNAEIQSGDLQGLSRAQVADSESVAELVAEGQAFEAEVIDGMEDGADSPVREVKTRQIPEDDVPLEYLNQER